jgi:hypothetical protein
MAVQGRPANYRVTMSHQAQNQGIKASPPRALITAINENKREIVMSFFLTALRVMVCAILWTSAIFGATYVVPHYTFRDQQWQTELSLVNPGNEQATLHVQVFSSEGTLALEQNLSLIPGGGLFGSLTEILTGTLPDTGWLTIDTDQELSGLMTFQEVLRNGRSSLPLFQESSTQLLFPYIQNSADWMAGFSVVNPNEAASPMLLRLKHPSGVVLKEVSWVLNPREKRVAMVEELFPEAVQGVFALEILSAKPILGFALGFTRHLNQILAVPSTVHSGTLPATIPLESFRGTYAYVGYDRYVTLTDQGVTEYEALADGCIFESDTYSWDEIGEALLITDLGQNRYGIQREFWSFELVPFQGDLVPCQASEDIEAQFTALTDLYGKHYPFFKDLSLNWDAHVHSLEQQAGNADSDEDLALLLSTLVAPTLDGHGSVETPFGPIETAEPAEAFTRLYQEWETSGSGSFETYFATITNQFFNQSFDRYLTNVSTQGGMFVWGDLSEDTGYLFLNAMLLNEDEPLAMQVDQVEQIMANFIQDFASKSKVVIDLRINPGGTDWISHTIARFFGDQPRFGYAKHNQTSSGPTAFRTTWVDPRPEAFQGQVILLTSSFTASAAEVFVHMMKGLDQVMILGEPTFGGISDALEKTLPNGWSVTLSNERYVDAEGQCYEFIGHPVDMHLPFNTLQERQQGTDAALEAVLKLP